MKKSVKIGLITLISVIIGLFVFQKVFVAFEKIRAGYAGETIELSKALLNEYEDDTYSYLVDQGYMDKSGEYNIDVIKQAPHTTKLQFIHKIAHNVVNADAKWGEIVISHKSIEIGKIMFEDIADDDVVVKSLTEWQELNFNHDNTVELHNHVWNGLDGNIGEAKSMSEAGVANTIKILEGN